MQQAGARDSAPTNTPTPQPIPAQPGRRDVGGFQHRRNLLGALAAAPVAAAAPAQATTDPHAAWQREADALRACANGHNPADPLYDVFLDAAWSLEDRICETPAATLAGITVQLRLIVQAHDEEAFNDSCLEGLRNAIRSLELMAGRA